MRGERYGSTVSIRTYFRMYFPSGILFRWPQRVGREGPRFPVLRLEPLLQLVRLLAHVLGPSVRGTPST